MRYNLDKLIYNGQRTMIENSGDAYWEAMCDELSQPMFKLDDAAKVLEDQFGLAGRTARTYATAILANVMAESDGEVLTRIGRTYHWTMR